MELGADGVELDVHRTRDGVIVVHHDPEVAVPGREGRLPIAGLTAAEMTAVRVRGEPVPALAEVLALTGGAITAYCELKGAGTARGTLEALAAARARGAVHAFDHRQVDEARRLDPAVPRGVLEVSYPVDPLHALTGVQGRDLWRQWEHIDEALVTAAHAAGARVVEWTVNEPQLMARLAGWGVDALCTDDVALARSVVG
jgi:glycerophosphoryl diester phosphodiesterase